MTRVINLAGGKYNVEIEDSTGKMRALRYGEVWREEDLIGDNLPI